jgi:hypothetical protein
MISDIHKLRDENSAKLKESSLPPEPEQELASEKSAQEPEK